MSNTAAANAILPDPTGTSTALTGNAAAARATIPDVSATAVALTGNAAQAVALLASVSGNGIASNNAYLRLNATMPLVNAPLVDPTTGLVTPAWQRLIMALWQRTGGEIGTQSPLT